MIRAVFFDLGGVLVDVDLERSRRRWVELGAGVGFDQVFFMSGLKDRMDLGRIGVEETAVEVSRIGGVSFAAAQVAEVWNACILPRPEAFALVGRVRERVRVGVISDTDPIHARFIREACGLGRLADCWTLSCEVGVKKPDPGIFVKALGAMGVEAAEAVFVDDRIANVEGARAVGLRAEGCGGVDELRVILGGLGLI